MAFLALPILFAPDSPIYWFQFNTYAFHKFVLYLLFIGFFYLNYFLLIPRLYFSKRYIIHFLICVACFFVIVYIPDLILPWGAVMPIAVTLPPGAAPPFITDVQQVQFQKPFMLPHISDNFFLFIIVTFVSMTLRINSKLKRTEQERAEAQLSYLQSQINPHFLFNTLNSIYSIAISEHSNDTATAITKLSSLMRFVTTEAGRDLVTLDKEINYISDYIELQKIRLGNTVEVDYEVTGSRIGKKVAPLIIITFVENAFKHGVNPEDNSQIKILITISENDLHAEVSNNKVYHIADISKTGVGLRNTRSRLELMYPSRHRLMIDETAEQYNVSLYMDLR